VKPQKILIVEDDPAIGQSLLDGLKHHGFEADLCTSGKSGVEYAKRDLPHLVILDVRLPDGSGSDFCRQMRQMGLHQPIVILTAQHEETDKVLGLEMGADDYLSKPFAFGELLARLRALARRDPGERPVIITVGSLRLDPASAQAWRGEHEIRLSTREFALLEAFMRSPGQVLSHSQLLDAAWDIGHEYRSNVIEVYIRYLREKIDRPFGVRSLETVRGMGYRLRRDGGG